jgi:hypothetical protein
MEPKSEPLRGIFTGFEEYLQPTEEDYRAVLTAGLVVLDTNVLLNLYRYNVKVQDELVDLFGRLGDHVWVPRQVLVEFWRNREAVLEESDRGAEAIVDELREHEKKTLEAFRRWARRFALQDEEASLLSDAVSEGFARMCEGIQKLAEDDATAEIGADDLVLEKLGTVLEGRVGAPMVADAYKAALKEGSRRVDGQEPPGYLDKGKARRPGKEGAAGDYLVWEQVLVEAQARNVDVLFVTGDVKEDWWRIEHGQQRGPRPELADELRTRAGTRLFMLRPESLLRVAGRVLEFEVSDESLTEVKRVEEQLASRSRTADADSGWTSDTLSALLERLAEEGWSVQADVIRLAAGNDGFLDRRSVYERGGFAENRSLRGFTRPVNRITQGMRDSGEIPEDAVDVLSPVYEPDGYGLASGFSVPQEICPLIDVSGAF